MFFEALIIAGFTVTAACVISRQIGDAVKARREKRDAREEIWKARSGVKSSADLFAKK